MSVFPRSLAHTSYVACPGVGCCAWSMAGNGRNYAGAAIAGANVATVLGLELQDAVKGQVTRVVLLADALCNHCQVCAGLVMPSHMD